MDGDVGDFTVPVIDVPAYSTTAGWMVQRMIDPNLSGHDFEVIHAVAIRWARVMFGSTLGDLGTFLAFPSGYMHSSQREPI